MRVYKIFREDEYLDFRERGESAGAAVDRHDGYIHLSTADQVAETASRHFAGEEGLWLLTLDTDRLDALEWEPSRGGQFFPHLYRRLRADDVVAAAPLPLGPDGHDFAGLL